MMCITCLSTKMQSEIDICTWTPHGPKKLWACGCAPYTMLNVICHLVFVWWWWWWSYYYCTWIPLPGMVISLLFLSACSLLFICRCFIAAVTAEAASVNSVHSFLFLLVIFAIKGNCVSENLSTFMRPTGPEFLFAQQGGVSVSLCISF